MGNGGNCLREASDLILSAFRVKILFYIDEILASGDTQLICPTSMYECL